MVVVVQTPLTLGPEYPTEGAQPLPQPHPAHAAQTFMWSKAIPTFSLKSGLKRGTLA